MVRARSSSSSINGGKIGNPKNAGESRVPVPVDAALASPFKNGNDTRKLGFLPNGRGKLDKPAGISMNKVASSSSSSSLIPKPVISQRIRSSNLPTVGLRPSRLPLPALSAAIPECPKSPPSRLPTRHPPTHRRPSTPSMGGFEPGSAPGGTTTNRQLQQRFQSNAVKTSPFCNEGDSVCGEGSLPNKKNSSLTYPNQQVDINLIMASQNNRSKQQFQSEAEPTFVTQFHCTLQDSPPSIPPSLIRGLERQETQGLGRVKVMLRIAPMDNEYDAGSTSFLQSDARQKQLTVYEPASSSLDMTEERHIGVTAPKMFAFDAIFSPDDPQDKVCSKALGHVLPSVVNGSDACVFSYGYSKLGKSNTMIGHGDTARNFGLIPCAISWLFKLIHEQRQKTGARFSVRVSATEIAGKGEVLKDLLASYAKATEGGIFSPGMYLKDELFGQYLQNQSELRVPNAEKAAFYLDAAIAASHAGYQESDGICHFLFTLHIYQYRVDKSGKGGGVAGGRSRLYLMDLGACERQSLAYSYSKANRLSLANLGNVILAIFNGQKHVPYKDSKLTQLLRAILGNITCQATMIAHVSPLPSRYTESMATIQLASRIHRLRHKKWKNFSSGSSGGSVDRPFVGRMRGVRSSGSDIDCTSSSEQSCDTVIFLGPPRERVIREGVESLMNTDVRQELSDTRLSPPPPPFISNASFAQIRRTNGEMDAQRKVAPKPPNRFVPTGSFCDALPTGIYPLAYVPPMCCNSQKTVSECINTANCIPQPTFSGTLNCNGYSGPVATQRRDFAMVNTSDEFWVDGPRVNRSKFEAFRNESLPTAGVAATRSSAVTRETWVDGPQAKQQNLLQLLDNQKRAMIERWIDMQAVPVVSDDKDKFDGSDAIIYSEFDLQREAAAAELALREVEIVSNVDSFVSGDTESNKGKSDIAVPSEEPRRSNPASLLDDLQSKNYMDSDFYSRVMLHITEMGDDEGQWCRSLLLSETGSVDPEVAMMDSWVQVSEDEIMKACQSLAVDHPLRILSSESLAVSFTNSSRFSWDSGLNAMRQAFGLVSRRTHELETGLDALNLQDLTFGRSTRSVISDPGSGSGAHCRSETKLKDNLFGSCSLENMASFCRYNHSDWDFADAKSCDCSTDPFCGWCALKDLRCPDGCSDPHLDCNKSEPDVRPWNSLCDTRTQDNDTLNDELQCNQEISLDQPQICSIPPILINKSTYNNCCSRTNASEVPELLENNNRNKNDDNVISEFVNSARKKIHADNTSESKHKSSSIMTRVGCRVAPQPGSAKLFAKESFCSDSSHSPMTPDLSPVQFNPLRLERKQPCRSSPVASNRRRLLDKLSYDSGTGSSGTGSTRSSEITKEEPKKDASLGTTSSGYESMLRGSDRGSSGTTSLCNQDTSSLSSEDTALPPLLPKEIDAEICDNCITESTSCDGRNHHPGMLALKFKLSEYEEEDIERMERRRALEQRLQLRRHRTKILELRRKQQELKEELASAKSLLMIDPRRWSYDLYVEQSMDEDDPSFVEALAKETQILEKRVNACKSHVSMVTSFDVTLPGQAVTGQHFLEEEPS